MPRIPLFEDLTTGPIPDGSILMVEYDPASQWYTGSITIAAGWLRTGGSVTYAGLGQPPEEIRMQLSRLGLNTEQLESKGQLEIFDWYSATLGQKSQEKYAIESLKVSDLSIEFAKGMRGPTQLGWLLITDNLSVKARFNDEKAWVEFELTRAFPSSKRQKMTAIRGLMKGVHSEWAYKQLEGAVEGIIDFKLEEGSEVTRNIIRIRSMRNVGFDSRWHTLRIGENFEVTLEK